MKGNIAHYIERIQEPQASCSDFRIIYQTNQNIMKSLEKKSQTFPKPDSYKDDLRYGYKANKDFNLEGPTFSFELIACSMYVYV